jgi:hypothetical protein
MNDVQDSTPDAARQDSPPATGPIHANPHKRGDDIREGFANRTKGEAKFNFRTYVGLGYFGSVGATVALTYLLRDNPAIWPFYQKANNFLTRITRFGRTGEALEKHVKNVDSLMTIFSMFTGTTLMTIFPIKSREDRKPEIVREYDRDIYGEERVKNDPELVQAHALIDAAPKQTWRSIMSSRVLAFGATMGVAALVGSNSTKIAQKTGFSIDKISIKAGRAIGKALSFGNKTVLADIEGAIRTSPNDIARAAVNAQGLPQVPDRIRSRIANYLVLDGLYTIMTGGILYVFTRILAPVFDSGLKDREAALATALPRPANENHRPAANDPGPAKPATQVSHPQREATLAAAVAAPGLSV